MPKIRQHGSRSLQQLTAEATVSSSYKANNALDRNLPTMRDVRDTLATAVVQRVLLSESSTHPLAALGASQRLKK